MIGSPVLAATSGFLHAAGKFGSALGVEKEFVLAGRTIPATGLCRGSVLLSRVPAVWITVASIAGAVDLASAEDAVRQSILPATMLVCYGLWAIADIKLMTKSGAAIRPIAESVAALYPSALSASLIDPRTGLVSVLPRAFAPQRATPLHIHSAVIRWLVWGSRR